MAATKIVSVRQVLTVLAGCCVLLFGSCSPAPTKSALQRRDRRPPEIRPLHPIFDRSENELQKATGKLTWIGDQTGPVSTVVFDSTGYRSSMELFRDVQKNGHFGNDELPLRRFSVAPVEFKRLMTALKLVVSKSPDPDDRQQVSVSLARETGDKPEVVEYRIGEFDYEEFYLALLGALDADNKAGRDEVMRQFYHVVPSDMRKQK